MLVRRDDEENAVVLGLFAQRPLAEEIVGGGLDIAAVERGDRRHDELDAGLLLEIDELRLDARLRVRGDDMRRIDDPAGEVGGGLRESWDDEAGEEEGA